MFHAQADGNGDAPQGQRHIKDEDKRLRPRLRALLVALLLLLRTGVGEAGLARAARESGDAHEPVQFGAHIVGEADGFGSGSRPRVDGEPVALQGRAAGIGQRAGPTRVAIQLRATN